MKERGMIFNEYQVRALLDGRMTQTRRLMKADCMDICEKDDGSLWPWREDEENHSDYWYPCPVGAVGDRLWVRETWAEAGASAPELKLYRAHYPDHVPSHYENVPPVDGIRWTSSIHMPRWASRITLEITGVRVQRLKDADEGHLLDDLGDMLEDCDSVAGRAFNHAEHYAIAGVGVGPCPEMHGFKAWWDKTNGAGSFDANPWVWVIDFKCVEGGAA